VPPLLIVNARSGDATPTPEELCRAAEELGIPTHVLEDGEDPGEVARAAEADALGMAGGDGSLGAVAQAAIERDLPFACIPFGTRNHFARDLGLDRDDPLAALAAFGGRERRVDVGDVNGRVFLNNVSIGVYARLVHRREEHRRRRQALARVRALLLTAKEPHGLQLTVDGEPFEARIVLVGNNSYDLDLFSVGERKRLDEGRLHLYSMGGLLPHEWEERKGGRFEIDAPGPRLHVAADGEPLELETPLRLEARPLALRVLLPPGVEDERDVGERDLVS
jgi:diacylglycerol kinase family enzyme